MQIPNIYIKEVETILFSFIWEGNKVGKVSRNILIQDYGIGGQNMVHVESMIKTQYIMWLKRYKNETDGVWKKLVNLFFKKYGGLSLLMHCNYKENQFVNIPEFYINILKSWRIIRNV